MMVDLDNNNFSNIEDNESTEALDNYESEKKNKNLIKMGILGVGFLALAGIITGIIVAIQSADDIDGVSLDNGSNSSSSVKEAKAVAPNVVIENVFPVGLPEWGKISYFDQDKAVLRDQLYEKYSKTPIITTTMPLSSELLGYHIGGEMDDYQVLITKEEVVASTGEYIERIINPALGGWSYYQYSNSNPNENFPINNFKDMFTPEFFERNADKQYREYLPFYADWDSNDYGMSNLSEVARWYGEVNKVEADMINENSGSAELVVKADITYHAWLEDGSKVNKNAVLELDLVQGRGEERPMLVDNAKLQIK